MKHRHIRGRLPKKVTFVCGRSALTINSKSVQKIDSVKCMRGSVEVIDSFFYLRYQVRSERGCFESVVGRSRMGWENFRELLPL